MKKLLEVDENLQLLEKLVSGDAVSVNVSALSRILGRHRNTIQKKVDNIINSQIVDPPNFPFTGLYKIFPLLAVVRMDMPDGEECFEKIERWVKEDPQIFTAFKTRQGEYDTMLFTYHENITDYQLWMYSIPFFLELQYNVPEKYANFHTNTSYFSNQLLVKYNPGTGINLMERDFKENGTLNIQGYDLDELDLKILRCLVFGEGIKVNVNSLCEKTNLNRKTVEKRIAMFKNVGLISYPSCQFPNFFVPPSYLLSFVLVQLKKLDERVIREIIMDPVIPMAIQTIHGGYNLLIFGNHSSVEDQLRWEERYRKKFPDSFLSADITYLSPQLTIPFSNNIVSLSYIRRKLQYPDGMDLRRTIQSMGRVRARILYDLKHTPQ